MLLSGAHHPAVHTRHAQAVTPLNLNGTLNVISSATTQTQNADGSTTMVAPVQGQLGAMGAVRGVWMENTDTLGQDAGPDTVRLNNSQGTIVLSFNNAQSGRPHRTAQGTVYYQHNQRLIGGLGAYNRSSETGTINLNLNPTHKTVVSMTIQSKSG
jgi:hypothetical protein